MSRQSIDPQTARPMAKASLGAAGSAGRLRSVTDSQKGLWLDNGHSWQPVARGLVDPKNFGAIGDAASHPISAPDIAANPQWGGRYTAGDEWDYVGIQEAIYAAYGAPYTSISGQVCCGNGLGNAKLNGQLYIPAGYYLLNKTLLARNIAGATFRGSGRYSTILANTAANRPVLETNMVFSTMEGLWFDCLANLAGAALVEWTWDGSNDNTAAGLAHIHVVDCGFRGAQRADYGFRVARDLYQGDNVLLDGCYLEAFTVAAFGTGNPGYNALNLVLRGCDLISNFTDGILIEGGDVQVIACEFENGGPANQTGYDVHAFSSANCHSVILGCRSESLRLARFDSGHDVTIEGCEVINSTPGWIANTTYTTASYVRGVANKDGKLYHCKIGGQSGNVEPVWNGSGSIVDGGVTWELFDFDVVSLDCGAIRNCTLPYGRILVGQSNGPVTLEGVCVSRTDWLKSAGGENSLGSSSGFLYIDKGVRVIPGGGNNQGVAIAYAPPSVRPNTYPVAKSHSIWPGRFPFLFSHPDPVDSSAARAVGFWPGDGRYAGAPNDLERNVLGVIGAVAPPHASGANAAGADLLIQGGLGTGNQPSGAIRMRAAAPGGSGSSLNDPAALDALRINYLRVALGVPQQPVRVTTRQRDILFPAPNLGDTIYNLTLLRAERWNGFTWAGPDDPPPTFDLTYFGADLGGWWEMADPAALFQDLAATTLAAAPGDPIRNIADKTGNAHPLLLPGGATAPLWTPNVAAQGRPVCRTDGITGRLLTALFARPVPGTLIVIGRLSGAGAFAGAASGLVGAMSGAPTNMLFAYGTALQGFADLTLPFVAIGTYAGVGSTLWLNGTKYTGDLAPGGVMQGVCIGANFNGTGPAAFDFMEAAVVNRSITDQEAFWILLHGLGWGVEASVP